MSAQTTENDPKSNAFKKLDNDGHNYTSWSIRCWMVLLGLDLWDVINPTAHTSVCPGTHSAPVPSSSTLPATGTSSTTPAPALVPVPAITPDVIAEWDRKNTKAMSQLLTCINDMPLHLISLKTTVRDAWQALAD